MNDPSNTPEDGSRMDGVADELEPLGEKPNQSTTPKMLIPLFVVPLSIVAVVLAVFLGFHSLVGGESTPEDLVRRIESGGVNDRWQAASMLADVVVRSPEKLADAKLQERIRRAFKQSGPRGSRMRRYLAEVIATIEDEEAAKLLLQALGYAVEAQGGVDSSEAEAEEDLGAEIIHYVRALGRIGNPDALQPMLDLAKSSDAAYRQTVAAALGDLFYESFEAGKPVPPEALQALQGLHADDEAWVRMNSALSLAKLGSAESLSTLEYMLHRDHLSSHGLRFPDSGEYTVANHDPALTPITFALVAIASVAEQSGDPVAFGRQQAPLLQTLEAVSADDPSGLVRRRAQEILDLLRGTSSAAENDA